MFNFETFVFSGFLGLVDTELSDVGVLVGETEDFIIKSFSPVKT